MSKRERTVYPFPQDYLLPEDASYTCARAQFFPTRNPCSLPIVFRHYRHPFVRDRVFIPEHICRSNPYFSVFIYLSGDFSFGIGESYYPLKPGDVIAIGKNESYTVRYHKENAPLDYYEIDFAPDFFVTSATPRMISSLFFNPPAGNHHLTQMSPAALERLLSHLNQMDELIHSGTANLDQCLYAHFLSVVHLIVAERGNRPTQKEEKKLSEPLSNAITYMRDNFTTIRNIRQVAVNCGIGAPYLSHLFRDELDTTPVRFLRLRFL